MTTTSSSDRRDLASIPRTTPEEAWKLISDDEAVLVDTRPIRYYLEEHAEGAIPLPFEAIRQNPQEAINGLPPGRKLIFYCT